VKLRPLLITIWSEVLKSDLTGTSWAADSVTLSRAALPVSDEIKTLREKAMSGLFDLFGQSTSEAQKREVMSALQEATRAPQQAEYSNELRSRILLDNRRLVDFLIQRAMEQSYELLEHLEYVFLYDYRRAREIAEDEKDRFGCRSVAKNLVESIEIFRDKVNADQQFVRYKTLVGFESVFPPHWKDEDFDFGEADKFRHERTGGIYRRDFRRNRG
jgi:hypothetical protein